MEEVIRELPIQSEFYNFSSLKGTSKVQNGQIRFLSSKISLVISAPEAEFVEQWVKKIRQLGAEYRAAGGQYAFKGCFFVSYPATKAGDPV